jgi:Ca2+-binding RTX toxin-like protein
VDTVAYGENGGPEVNVKITLVAGPQTTGAGTWSLTDIENLSGGRLNDDLTGDAAANVLAGDVGNDTLSGGDGDDALYGDGMIAADTFSDGRTGGAPRNWPVSRRAGRPYGRRRQRHPARRRR